MTKIPMRETVNAAYRFTFDNFAAIIGLIWVPMLLVVGLDYLQSNIAAGRGDEMASADVIRILAYTFGMLLLYAIMYVAVTEQALGLKQGRRYFHIALGIAEFRAFGAMLTFGLLMAVFFLIVIGGALALSYVQPAVGAVFQLMGVGFLIFCAIRLGFLLIPAIVAEQRISLERSWILTQGNFWRIVGIYVVLLGPVLLTGVFAIMLFMSDDMAGLQAKLGTGKPTKEFAEAFDNVLAAHKPHMMLVTFLLSPFTVGFSLGAAAHAYRLLTRQPGMPQIDSAP